MWIERLQENSVRRLAETRPAVMLTGARQTGKSSLLQKMYPNTEYVTFDHLHHVEAAREMPERFLRRFNGSVILDEVQYVPQILRHLKILVDEDRDSVGRWILTGSQQFELMENVSETMAGRIGICRLETLSAEELRAQGIAEMSEHLVRGGYPELWKNRAVDAGEYYESYLRTYLERDLSRIVDVKKLTDFRRFLRMLALRAGQLVNFRSVAADTGVSDATVRKWTHALEISGLVHLLPPYFANLGKRLIKTPKLFFSDHGLLCRLIGVDTLDDWMSHPQRGQLWENFVMMELVKTHGLLPGRELFFYRDQNGVEIDFVIEKRGRITFVEAKAGETVDRRKLNFDKVIPLFSDRFTTDAILACQIASNVALDRSGFRVVNPLLTDIALHH